MYNCECGAELIQEDCETIIGVCQESPVVKDYNALVNKPQINGVTLQGNKTSEDLGIAQEITDAVSAEATLRENADTALGGRIDDEITAREGADTALGGRIDNANTRIDNEILARQGADNNLQTQIDAITSKSDVVDVVADYQALLAYDTSKLNDNDVIKVLDDETHEDALTYYRWSTATQTWSYIGQEAPYYSKGQMDVLLQDKQDKLIAGANIQIAQDGKTISATDTTYTAGNGLNLNGTEFSADTTVLATKSDLDSYYTKTETDTKLAPKLEAEVVAELPSTGTEGKLYLTPKNYTTGTATGNPITISLGEDAGQITSAQLDGDTYQQSYTGKNLLALGETSYTYGLTVTQDTANNSITFSGTTTKAWPNISDKTGLNIPAGTYTLSIKSALPYTLALRLYREDGTYPTGIGSAITSGNTSATFTIDFDCHRVWLLYGVTTTGTTVPETTIEEIMLEAGSLATSFEPYVGGQASPNPDYPQPIQTVTGEQTVTVVGKNLAQPIDAYTYSTNGSATITSQANGEVTFTTSSSSVSSGVYIYKTTGNNATLCPELFTAGYTVSFDAVASATCTLEFGVTGNHTTATISTTKQRVSVATATGAGVVFYNNSQNGATITISDIQVELGSTATTYTPYSKQTLPINLGKNLFNKDNYSSINAFIDANGKLVSNANNVAVYIPCEANTTYTISRKVPASGNSKFGVGYATTTPAGNVQLYGWTRDYNAQNLIVTTGEQATYLVAWVYVVDYVETEAQTMAAVQIEKGSVASPYAAYFTPIELCKLGTYQDYIYKSGSDWKVHKVTSRATLNGTEPNWGVGSELIGNYQGYYIRTDYAGVSSIRQTNAPLKATNLTQLQYASSLDEQGIVYSTTASKEYLIIGLLKTTASNLTEFKAWLANNNVNLLYPLATPTDTTITDQTLIAQLEAVRTASLQASNTITNTANGSNLAGDMELNYHEYDPHSRYNKWLWLDINENYEQIGS